MKPESIQSPPLEDRIKAQGPLIWNEMERFHLVGGARVDHLKTVVPRYGKPDVIEKILGKGFAHSNGHTILTEQQILQLLIQRDFGDELRTPQSKKKAGKVAKQIIEEHA